MTYHFEYISETLKKIIEPATCKTHFFESELQVREFDNAFIAPYVSWDLSIGSVLDSRGNAVKDSECLEWKENGAYYDIHQSQKVRKKAIFIGFLLTVFGHSFTDNLRKLWFTKTNRFNEIVNEGAEVVYTTSWNLPLPETAKEIIKLTGFDISIAKHITDLSQYEVVYIPDNCYKSSPYGRLYSREYSLLINMIKESLQESQQVSPDKIYFTRSKFSGKKEYGEKAIERVFAQMGYTIIAPESYPIWQQIHFVNNCICFATTEGSIAHLSLFCKPGTEIVLLNKANYLNFHQVMINEFANLNVTYIEAHHSSKVDPEHPWWGPFYLCITKYLERYIGHPIIHVPYWIRFSYWRYTRNILYRCYNRGRKILNRVFMK